MTFNLRQPVFLDHGNSMPGKKLGEVPTILRVHRAFFEDTSRRAGYRLLSLPVNVIEPTAGHPAQPPRRLYQNNLQPLSSRRHCCHHTAGSSTIDAQVSPTCFFYGVGLTKPSGRSQTHYELEPTTSGQAAQATCHLLWLLAMKAREQSEFFTKLP